MFKLKSFSHNSSVTQNFSAAYPEPTYIWRAEIVITRSPRAVVDFENYAKLAEGRAEAYAKYAQAVYYYTLESTYRDFSTQLVQQAFIELTPIYEELLQLEFAENVLSATDATYRTIVDFKDYLNSLTDPLIEVINRFVYGANASQTYLYLTSLESLCRQEAEAWRSGDLDNVKNILTQEAKAIVPPNGAIPYVLGFRNLSKRVDENAYKVADATINFLNRETTEIANLGSIVTFLINLRSSY